MRRLATGDVDEAEATGPLERWRRVRADVCGSGHDSRLWSQHALPSRPSEAKRPQDGGGLPEDAGAWQRGPKQALVQLHHHQPGACRGQIAVSSRE